VLHQNRQLLLREAPECRILPSGSFLNELPERLYVVDNNFPLSQNLETESDGEYKVLNVVHIGDTQGNEWFTHVDCVATSTKAGLPFVPSDYTWALGL
jgi:hypothetical protein